MRRALAGGLQVLGLVTVPLGLLYGVELGSSSLELAIMVFGAALFVTGRMLDPGR